MDGDPRLGAGNRHQPALDGEGPDAGKDIAAILGICDDGLVHENLEEQIVHVDPFTGRPGHHGHLAGQRIGPAHAVNLAGIGRSHYAEQESVARGYVGW